MAEGLLKSLYAEKYEVYSAGTDPTKVNPLAIKAMAEIGIDISKQYSKGLEEYSDVEIDLAVSVCKSSAKTLCSLCSSPTTLGRPLIINAKLQKTRNYVVHGFEDPSEIEGSEEEKMKTFRRIREQMKTWIAEYFADPEIAIQKSENAAKPKLA